MIITSKVRLAVKRQPDLEGFMETEHGVLGAKHMALDKARKGENPDFTKPT